MRYTYIYIYIKKQEKEPYSNEKEIHEKKKKKKGGRNIHQLVFWLWKKYFKICSTQKCITQKQEKKRKEDLDEPCSLKAYVKRLRGKPKINNIQTKNEVTSHSMQRRKPLTKLSRFFRQSIILIHIFIVVVFLAFPWRCCFVLVLLYISKEIKKAHLMLSFLFLLEHVCTTL